MEGKQRRLFGGLLIVAGVYYLIQSFGIFPDFWRYSWPVLLLILSAGFHVSFFLGERDEKKTGLLMPGGVLLVLGGLFLYEAITGWHNKGGIWFYYLLAPALGFLEMWLFGGREKKWLIPAFWLLAASFFSASEQWRILSGGKIWPVLAIAAGFYYLFRKQHSEKPKE
ncbi:hypothetical protein CEF21_09755 [Bacillus sp. FJAT-42376]|uniref:LiaI-LiaF-like domain-containing protein n=1 Tax=Bacillus sp. FJAT-42376 TaxID=2014076 RepID=UPI000F50A561|nr:DUF5668 domain-containing protein [Bacillus sp. FJAT-42376]AZB42547.1 hypothetical protein CEF21_09755 [Bacillus sp. FJAT-42376]